MTGRYVCTLYVVLRVVYSVACTFSAVYAGLVYTICERTLAWVLRCRRIYLKIRLKNMSAEDLVIYLLPTYELSRDTKNRHIGFYLKVYLKMLCEMGSVRRYGVHGQR